LEWIGLLDRTFLRLRWPQKVSKVRDSIDSNEYSIRSVPEDPLNNIAHSLRQISDSLRTLRADHAPRLHVGRAQTTVAVKPDLATELTELRATVEKLTKEENAALETFVAILSEQDAKKA